MSYIILILQYFTLSKIFVIFVIHEVIPDLFSVLICIIMVFMDYLMVENNHQSEFFTKPYGSTIVEVLHIFTISLT